MSMKWVGVPLTCLPKPSFADMACHVGDMSVTCLRSCRRHGNIECRLECLNDTTFDDIHVGDSRHFGFFVIVVSAQTQKLYGSYGSFWGVE